MVRKVISIIFYILGGFFVYMVCLIAFINIPQVGATKFVIVGGFTIPAVLFLFVGGAISRFQNWKSHTGITLLSGVGFNLLAVISIACIYFSPEFEEYLPKDSFASFNDYLSGFSIMFVLAGLGFILAKSNNKVLEAGESEHTAE